MLGLAPQLALPVTVVVIGMTGALYAVFGGLKAVAGYPQWRRVTDGALQCHCLRCPG